MRWLQEAAWWIADYAYAANWQVRATLSRQHARSFESGHLAPVVILPGVYESWKFMLPLIRELHGRGHPVHVVGALRHNRAAVADGAGLVTALIVERGLTGAVIVAHSKGGLLGKFAMTNGAARNRISAMIAIATPFHGSRYARLLPGRTLRAFLPTDATLVLLGRELESNAHIVSVFAAFDPHIPESSELPGARNVRINTGGHFRVLAHPRTIAETVSVAGGHTSSS